MWCECERDRTELVVCAKNLVRDNKDWDFSTLADVGDQPLVKHATVAGSHHDQADFSFFGIANSLADHGSFAEFRFDFDAVRLTGVGEVLQRKLTGFSGIARLDDMQGDDVSVECDLHRVFGGVLGGLLTGGRNENFQGLSSFDEWENDCIDVRTLPTLELSVGGYALSVPSLRVLKKVWNDRQVEAVSQRTIKEESLGYFPPRRHWHVSCDTNPNWLNSLESSLQNWNQASKRPTIDRSDQMLLKYFYDTALAHASYLVGCQKTGEAFIIDPARDIAPYLEAAAAEKMKITGSVETHIHADYVSGNRELAEATGATLYLSDEGPSDWKYQIVDQYEHRLLKDGDEIRVGKILLTVVHTPGHTPESLSFILTDEGGGADQPMGIFTGDFVFVGSIGRPDLLEKAAGVSGAADAGARALFRSIQKFNELPDYLQVWPAHGAGSACGKGLGSIPSTTVGYEKRFNAALKFTNEDEFVAYILAEQPEPPPYFALMKRVNKEGPALIKNRRPEKVAVDQLEYINQRNMVVDISSFDLFANGHVPGTVNLPLKYLASEGGWLLDYQQPVYLIASGDELRKAVRILHEIGVDNIGGYFDSNEVSGAGKRLERYENRAANQVANEIKTGAVRLIDVRRQTEWDSERIDCAEHRFLGRLLDSISEIKADATKRPVVLQCRTGSRSAIAASLLQAAGVKNVINLSGGIEQWQADGQAIVAAAHVVAAPNCKLGTVATSCPVN